MLVPTVAHREAILDATVRLLERDGAGALNVRAIMREAGVSRTIFYRHFASIELVLHAVLVRVLSQLQAGAVDWIERGVIGSPDVVAANLLQSGRNVQPHAALIVAIHDAGSGAPELRRLWRDTVLQNRIDAVEAAIRRDQVAGTIRSSLDPAAVAYSLILLNETVALEVLGRRSGSPEEFVELTAPIWFHVLFDEPGSPH